MKEYWQLDQLEQYYHTKQLKEVLSSDPVLKILKSRQIGLLQTFKSAYVATSNQLEAVYVAGSWIYGLII